MYCRASVRHDKADVWRREVPHTRLKAVKAEAALSILAFNMLHAVNAFGAERLTPAG
jgi:hypothetical protein